jgi:hypothetical protein
MLIIRREQLKAFEKAFESRFVRQAMSALAEEMPEECERLGKQRLQALLEKTVAKCDRYGISEEDLLLQFARLQIDHGTDFDISPEDPWARPILGNAATDQHEKIDRLELESFSLAGIDYIHRRKPEILEEHGEKGFRDTIAAARGKCRSYHIDLRRHGLRYLWLMCVLGADFDIAQETAWAGRILEDDSLGSAEKIRRLEEKAGMQIDVVPGDCRESVG